MIKYIFDILTLSEIWN